MALIVTGGLVFNTMTVAFPLPRALQYSQFFFIFTCFPIFGLLFVLEIFRGPVDDYLDPILSLSVNLVGIYRCILKLAVDLPVVVVIVASTLQEENTLTPMRSLNMRRKYLALPLETRNKKNNLGIAFLRNSSRYQ